MDKQWCLVLVLWGEKYTAQHINAIVQSVFQLSKSCARAFLFTDRRRDGIHNGIQQVLFSDDFNQAEFKENYTIKLSLFDPRVLPPGFPCVYLDLDSVVIGDLGRIAALVQRQDDLFMLPPGGLLGFGVVRRMIFRLTGGQRMATGNSSILAFHSDMKPNVAMEFLRLKALGGAPPKVLLNDDLFISWVGQMQLRAVPSSLGVMFRREFLNRLIVFGWIKNRLPWVLRRREQIVAVTFNGIEHKLEKLLQIADDTLHHDSKGRFGYLGIAEMGPIKNKIERAALGLYKSES